MKRVQLDGLIYYKFDIFEPFPELEHGVFTRSGGVSEPPCEGLNVAFKNEDRLENVQDNIRRVAEVLKVDGLAYSMQVHGDRTLLVRAEDNYRPTCPGEVKDGYDALMTPDPEVGLLIKLADCQGVILYDPEIGGLAAVHSGWRGSVQNILGRTVRRMAEALGAKPENIRAGISPSLGPCCGEFVNYKEEFPEHFWPYRRGAMFDFWAISRDQLTAAGLRPEHIEVAGMCTVCGDEGFYSYRRDKAVGRFALAAVRRRTI